MEKHKKIRFFRDDGTLGGYGAAREAEKERREALKARRLKEERERKTAAANIRRQINAARLSLESKKRIRDEIKKGIEDMEKRISDIEKEMRRKASLTKASSPLASKKKAVEQKMKKFSADAEKIKTKLRAHAADKDSVKRQIAALEMKIKQLRLKEKTIDAAARLLSGKLRTAEKVLQDANRTLGDITALEKKGEKKEEADKKMREKEILSIKRQVAQKKTLLLSAEREYKKKEGELAALERELTALGVR